MGSLYKNGRVRSYIMILLVITALLISSPVKKMITERVNNRVEAFSSLLYEKTGLSITYEKLSPSILTNFYIRGIKLYDGEKILLSIDKTKINYSIWNILRKDYQKGVSSIIVDGINIDVDELINLSQSIKSDENNSITIAEVKKNIPGSIKLKNINLEYNDNNVQTLLAVKNISVSNPIKRNTVDIQADINLDTRLQTTSSHITGKIDLSGSITEDLDGSQLNLKLRNLTDGNYRLSKLNLHAAYDSDRFDLHTIQAVNPISFGITYDLNTGDVNAQLRMDGLSPIAILTVNSRQLEVEKFRNLKIYTDTIIKSNIKAKTLNYITDSRFLIPDEAFPQGLDMRVSLYGNEKKAELTNFSVNGPLCSAAAKLSCVYETKQLSGYIEIPEFTLPNGNVISTELYFDPLEKGFMAFSPQIFIGSRALTALQLTMLPQKDSYDITFELSDYSHIDETDAGVFKFDGSYLPSSNYLQSNITLNSLYLDSIAQLAAQFLPEKDAKKTESFAANLAPYLLSGDVYVGTDFKTFSYNVPYLILANSKKINQAVMFALNGTDSSIQLNQFSFVIGNYAIEAFASLEKSPDSSDMFFVADIKADTIPYHFTGSIMPETCIITGDYGTDIEVRFGNNKSLAGHTIIKSLPLKVLDKSFVFSTTTDFTYDTENGPSIKIENLEIEDAGSSSLTVNPKVVVSGSATRYGASIDSIYYTDLYSTLEGNADLLLNINESIFDSIGVMLNLKNPITEEGITVDGSISNPNHLAINKETLLNNIYVNLQMQLKNFGLNRFMDQKNDNNMVSGMLFASGTIEHPYISLNVDTLSVLIAADMLYGNGNILIEDRDLSINDLNISFQDFDINNIQASASISDWTLDATGEFSYEMLGNSLHAPLVLTVGNAIVPEGKFFPDTISATLSTPEFSGNMLKKSFPLSLSAYYSNKVLSFYSSENAGINGTYTSDGMLEMNIDNNSFISAKLDGFVNMSSMNLEAYDLSLDLAAMGKYLNLDDVMIIDSGMFEGNVVITGTMNDPDINGIAQISSPAARLPILTKQKLTAPDIMFTIENNEIHMMETTLSAKNNQRILAELRIFLNKWTFEHLEGNFKTYKNDQFPINFKTDFCSLDGNIGADIALYFENNTMELTGKLAGENVDMGVQLLSISNLSMQDNSAANSSVMVVTDLDITLGTHASVRLDPILRCVFAPNTTIKVVVNQPEDLYMIDGQVKLKTGDLAYLNRSFYIKSGNIKFNKDDITNPIITVNAETREKDDQGQTVKIILDVEDQYLMDLQPRFSSVPPKSESEIQQLLGQIVMADADNATSLLFSASDYAIQSTVVRKAENKLRDLLNFDIFSLRTNVLQNTYNLSIARAMEKEKGNQKISIGNFLDNTTVYIGKYLGNSLYVDAMLHLSFEDSKVNDISEAGKVLFQPEFGMELESPFANIRVNMAPDINALLKNQFVPSASVTLSWKFAF